MIKHLQYLRYVIRHKWFVMQAMLKWRKWRLLMLWRGIIHDWQKFTPAEWGAYVQSFYGPYKYEDRPPELVEEFDRAWLHHQHHGPHHWQHWVLREDDGQTKALRMPGAYVQEMLADWSGAGKAIHGNPDPFEWYMRNREKIILHPATRHDVEMLLHAHLFGENVESNT